MKIGIVTGASSGIGKEFVRQLMKPEHGLDEIWVIARREECLNSLRKKYGNKIRVLALDLLEESSMEIIRKMLKKEKNYVKVLVNSAGYGKIGRFEVLPYQDIYGMIGLNCRVLTQMTHLCLPYMKRGSRIFQMASLAAFLPQADFAVYAATKSYVLSFSRALTREVRPRGIRVTAICPGPVQTEFFDRAQEHASIPAYKKLAMAGADHVVALALKDSAGGKEVSVYGAAMKLIRCASKLIPHRVILDGMELWKKKTSSKGK